MFLTLKNIAVAGYHGTVKIELLKNYMDAACGDFDHE